MPYSTALHQDIALQYGTTQHETTPLPHITRRHQDSTIRHGTVLHRCNAKLRTPRRCWTVQDSTRTRPYHTQPEHGVTDTRLHGTTALPNKTMPLPDLAVPKQYQTLRNPTGPTPDRTTPGFALPGPHATQLDKTDRYCTETRLYLTLLNHDVTRPYSTKTARNLTLRNCPVPPHGGALPYQNRTPHHDSQLYRNSTLLYSTGTRP